MKNLLRLRTFIKTPAAFLDEEVRTGEAVKLISFGVKDVALVFGAEEAREILTARSGEFIPNRRIFSRIRPVTGDRGLVQLQGAESRSKRSEVRAVFSGANLEELPSIVTAYARESFDKLGDGPQEIDQILSDLVLRTAVRMFLGLELSAAVTELTEHFLELNRLCGGRMMSLFVFPSLKARRLRRRLRDRIQVGLKGSAPLNGSMASILQSDPDLIDHCMTFLFAGHETTAASVTFALQLLARHPELQVRIANGDEALALNVYKEALRLFPPAYMLVREAAEETTLGGVPLKRGTPVIIGLKQLQRRRSYFEAPEVFDPNRFAESPLPLAFMPFGLGPKSCIGEAMAYKEAVVLLQAFCQAFTFTSTVEEIRSQAHITLHPAKGQPVDLRRKHVRP